MPQDDGYAGWLEVEAWSGELEVVGHLDLFMFELRDSEDHIRLSFTSTESTGPKETAGGRARSWGGPANLELRAHLSQAWVELAEQMVGLPEAAATLIGASGTLTGPTQNARDALAAADTESPMAMLQQLSHTVSVDTAHQTLTVSCSELQWEGSPLPLVVDLPPYNPDVVIEGTFRLGDKEGTYRLRPVAARIDIVRLWVNVFIAGHMEGVTRTVPGDGEHAGKTMVTGPPHGDCFLTDQRSFSDDPSASVRVQTMFEFTTETGEHETESRSGETIEVDCEDGDEEGRARATTRNLRWTGTRVDRNDKGDPIGFQTRAGGTASDPLVLAAGVVAKVDFTGVFVVNTTDDWRTASVRYSGVIENFPHYEIYAQADSGQVLPVVLHAAASGATPYALMGAADVGVNGSALLTAQ